MKKIQKLIMGAIFLAVSATASATPQETVPDFKPNSEDIRYVQAQVKEFLSNKKLSLREVVDLNVILYVNQENELVVLDLNSRDEKVMDFIMQNLNSKKFNDGLDRRGHTYICPIRIKTIS